MNTLEYLKTNRDLLVLASIEKQIKMPATTLNRYVQTGYLPQKWAEPLRRYLERAFKTQLA